MPCLTSPPQIADRIVLSVPTPVSTNNSIIPESLKREYIVLNKHKLTWKPPVQTTSYQTLFSFFLLELFLL